MNKVYYLFFSILQETNALKLKFSYIPRNNICNIKPLQHLHNYLNMNKVRIILRTLKVLFKNIFSDCYRKILRVKVLIEKMDSLNTKTIWVMVNFEQSCFYNQLY